MVSIMPRFFSNSKAVALELIRMDKEPLIWVHSNSFSACSMLSICIPKQIFLQKSPQGLHQPSAFETLM